jgi:hypothetical protein
VSGGPAPGFQGLDHVIDEVQERVRAQNERRELTEQVRALVDAG